MSGRALETQFMSKTDHGNRQVLAVAVARPRLLIAVLVMRIRPSGVWRAREQRDRECQHSASGQNAASGLSRRRV